MSASSTPDQVAVDVVEEETGRVPYTSASPQPNDNEDVSDSGRLNGPDGSIDDVDRLRRQRRYDDEPEVTGGGGLTRWRSEPTTFARSEVEDGVETATSINDDDDDDDHRFPVHATYHGSAVEPLPERARSLTDVKTSAGRVVDDRTSAARPARCRPAHTSMTDGFVRPTVVANISSTGNACNIGQLMSSSDVGFRCDDDGDSIDLSEFVVDVSDKLTETTFRSSTTPSTELEICFDDDDHEARSNGYVNVDSADGLERALAAGRRAPNTAGLDRALRAKERESRGGMAYYVDLEPHFDQLQLQSTSCIVGGSSASLAATTSNDRSASNR